MVRVVCFCLFCSLSVSAKVKEVVEIVKWYAKVIMKIKVVYFAVKHGVGVKRLNGATADRVCSYVLRLSCVQCVALQVASVRV